MKKGLFRSLNDLSIRNKLFVSYLALIVVPFSMFLFINTFVTEKENENEMIYSAHKVLNQTKTFLEFKTESARNSLNVVALNDTVQEILEKSPEAYSENIGGLWLLDSGKLNKELFVAKSNPDIYKIHIYMKKGLASLSQNEDFMNLNTVEDSKWYKKLISGRDVIRWFGKDYFPQDGDESCIHVVRFIPRSENINENLGVIDADIPESTFRLILDQSVFTKSTSIVLINSDGELICTSSGSISKDPAVYSGILSSLTSSDSDDGSWDTLDSQNGKILVGAQPVKNSDWTLLLTTPFYDIHNLSNKSRRQMISVFLIVTVLTLPLTFLTAVSAVKRIKLLIVQMRRVVNGDFNIDIIPSNSDEIGELTRNFNYMLTRMAMLIDEKYALGKEIKSLELKALQTQINPHFLYNTLDLINWMSKQYRARKIEDVVAALSKFYKLSLNYGEDTISIRDELEHVKAYVLIQNMRFKDRISLELNIPESLFEYGILKIILQPLVENAIIHGILEKGGESGKISVYGELDGCTINLFVQDDGVGLSSEKMSQILASEILPNSHNGYGVRNIDQRLKLNYGNDFGLSFESVPGRGTTVKITIPAVKLK